MISEFFIITGFILSISSVLLWQRNSLQRLLGGNPLARRKNRYQHERVLCIQTKKCLEHLQKQSKSLYENPESAWDILKRLVFLLPVSGIFTEQRTRLHFLAGSIRRELFVCLKREGYKRLNNRKDTCILSMNFNRLVNINTHIERIDWATAEQERRVVCLIQLAQNYMAARHYMKLPACIKIARKIQHFNGKILKGIHRTEKQLIFVSRTSKDLADAVEKNERKPENALNRNA